MWAGRKQESVGRTQLNNRRKGQNVTLVSSIDCRIQKFPLHCYLLIFLRTLASLDS